MSFAKYLEGRKELVAMIHLDAMPGTPRGASSPRRIIERAVEEARLYQRCGVHTVMIENMHDVPYVRQAGAEVVATMAIAGARIKELGLRCGIQILAGCNREALGAALAAELDFIRVEGFVFGHLGDEGYFDACAGDLLRYRAAIGANDVLVFTDIKKKHSAHAITADVDIVETARAAAFFLTDGVVVTGTSTGAVADVNELKALAGVPVRKIVGSGVTADNLALYHAHADLFIVGSSLKVGGVWSAAPDEARVRQLVAEFSRLAP